MRTRGNGRFCLPVQTGSLNPMESATDFWTAKALLDWQIEMGADEAITDTPIDRYSLPEKAPGTVPAKGAGTKGKTKAAPPPIPTETKSIDTVAAAKTAAMGANDLNELRAALDGFDHCALKVAARNLVFSDGTEGAPVMILTDAPTREDDRAGQLFSGASGRLLDKMLVAIDCARNTNIYAAPIIPWNPPQDRDLTADELAMMMPFVERHIALAAPKLLVLMGNGPCQALLGKSGVTRLRGTWTSSQDLPALPMLAPTFLMANPLAKRDAWADLLSLKARLKELG